MLEEVKRPAFFTAAYDLDGNLKIQQMQYRNVLVRDGVAAQELELYPPELLHVALPTPQDVLGDLKKGLGEVASTAAVKCAELEANLAETQTDLEAVTKAKTDAESALAAEQEAHTATEAKFQTAMDEIAKLNPPAEAVPTEEPVKE